MALPSPIPIVIGVGDITNRSLAVADAIEPLQLMHQAILQAISDTDAPATLKLQSGIDSIDIVRTWTWPYTNLPDLLARKLGITPSHRSYSPHGGNQPAKLFDEAAQRIAKGESRVAVVVGGEALASCLCCPTYLERLSFEFLMADSKCLCKNRAATSDRMDGDRSTYRCCLLANNQRSRFWYVFTML